MYIREKQYKNILIIIQKEMPYYAVAKGNQIGIFSNWSECRSAVHGFKQPKYKKFDTEEEAKQFVEKFGSNKQETNEIHATDYYVYTDGSCHNNGQDNATAGIGIYFGENDPRNVSREIDGKKTNNVAELTAIIETFRIIKDDIDKGKHITICTDSEYAIKCATTYGKSCAENNWTKDIPNKELVKSLFDLYSNQDQVRMFHVRAHTNNEDSHSIGNAEADKLANASIGVEMPIKVLNEKHDNKIYLKVPYKDKEIIKVFEGKWDKQKKMWYIYHNNSRKDQVLKLFEKQECK